MVALPASIPLERYAQAAQLYGQKIRGRTLALYQVGNVRFPGLSDLDLLAVTHAAQADNSQFFSVYQRLPEVFHQLFLHQPFLVPAACLDILRYTTHTGRRLLWGEDVAAEVASETSATELWCRLFEGICTHQSFFANVEQASTIRARHMVAVANSLRFSLGFLDTIAGTSLAKEYAGKLDSMRHDMMIAGNAEEIARNILEQYHGAFQRLQHAVRASLSLDPAFDLADFGRRLLRGEVGTTGLDAAFIRRRYQEIVGYHSELVRCKLSYGYLFFLAAYGKSVPQYRQNAFTARLFSLYYRTATWRPR